MRYFQKMLFSGLLFLLFSFVLCGKESFALVENGKVLAGIVRLPETNAVELAAADELVEYVDKITSGRLARRRKLPEGMYPIYIALADNKNLPLPAKARALVKKIRKNGFLLYADKSGLFLTAKEKIALRYAVAEVLKRYGNVRWITPGPEGEFVKKSSSFKVPAIAENVNPSFLHRSFNLVGAWGYVLTPLWQVRNNMTQYGERFGGDKRMGGHCFSTLLPDIYFKEKPELYGLYNGKRVPQCGDEKLICRNGGKGGQKNQPCTSNPETIRIMQENLVKTLKANPHAVTYTILNNDSSKWCECENCKKLDPPEEKKRGRVSTRFWLLVNALIDAGKKAAPHVRFVSSPYQTFQEYPLGVVPRKEADINFCLHHRCYLHSIGDKKCFVNERYRKILAKWHKEKRNVQTYEYTNILPRGEVWYLPTAPLIHQDLKYYSSIGNDGWCDEVAPYDGIYVKDSRQGSTRWKGGALDLYLIARMLWNVNMDYAKEEEEAGSLYYGKAWKEMKKFRHRLFQVYKGINDHFYYGAKLWRLGRALVEERGAEKELLQYLENAALAAAGDKRVEELVARDKEFFMLTFVESMAEYREKYQRNYVRAGVFIPNDLSCKDLADYAYAGNLTLKFLFDKNSLYILYNAPASGEKSKLEILTEKERKVFPVSGKAGKSILPLKGIKSGESMKLGVIYHNNGKKYSWNGDSFTAPGIYRLVYFGNEPIIKNGDFATFRCEKGKYSIGDFAYRGKVEVVSDPSSAAVGKNHIRGRGYIYQYLRGLRGPMQTYVAPPVYKGKLKISYKCRGTGSIAIRLTTDRLKKVANDSAKIDSPEKWQEISFIVDCKENTAGLLLLYIHFSGKGKNGVLDIDDVRVEKL